jgi:hypothetical protein
MYAIWMVLFAGVLSAHSVHVHSRMLCFYPSYQSLALVLQIELAEAGKRSLSTLTLQIAKGCRYWWLWDDVRGRGYTDSKKYT